jgi:8-oxo-dGTP pyrophosphatase MutT (NUDIX family)
MANTQRPVVCLLAVRDAGSGPLLLMQRRQKGSDDDTPYSGYLELPQGKIENGESLAMAAQRELKEETGLELDSIQVGAEEPYGTTEGASSLYVAHPLLIVTDTDQNHLGIALIVHVSGIAADSPEAGSHQWLTPPALRVALDSQQVFPLNCPMIEAFLRIPNNLH